jgi:transposase
MEDGVFGSSTPSSKIPIKPNAKDKEKKPKGARLGHKGSGRKIHEDEIDRIIEVEAPEVCPECGKLDGDIPSNGRLFEGVPHKLIEEFRQSPVKHTDETSWRTDGKNGYVWLFATPEISIFRFGKNRSCQVAQAVFGKEPLPGVLVVDRYGGYKKVPCKIQYCYAHLLRDIQDLEKEFPEDKVIASFVTVTAPLLAPAMGLRGQPITDEQFYRKAAKLASQIKAAMNKPAFTKGFAEFRIFSDKMNTGLYH